MSLMRVSTLAATWFYSASLAKLPPTFLRDLCTLILQLFQRINRLKLHFSVPVVPLSTRKVHGNYTEHVRNTQLAILERSLGIHKTGAKYF